MNQKDLVRALVQDRPFPDRPRQVRLVQTHMSYVFLTHRFVYKIKKALDLGFADFSTPALRRRFCHVEVSLNRRLAPRVYLGVTPIVMANGRPVLGGRGRAVEYAVIMRRLPDAWLLARRLKRGPGDYARITRVAEHLARFYAGTRVSSRDRDAGPRAIARIVQDNFEVMGKFTGEIFDSKTVADLRRWSNAEHARLAPLIARRARQGKAVHGHGDLHLAHIYVNGDVEILDCTEFARRFRVGDVAQDISFLAMDLEARGRLDLSRHLVHVLARRLRDPDLPKLVPYYKVYRALVRAKVNALLSAEREVPTPAREAARRRGARYLRLASRIARWRGSPALVVMAGLTGTGKTRWALDIAARYGIEWIATDVVRKRLAGIDPFTRADEAAGGGIYNAAQTARTMRAVLVEAEDLLCAGRPVVLDGTFQRRSDRDAARLLARRLGVPVRLVVCHARAPVVRRRLGERRRRPALSDGRWPIYLLQRRTSEPPDEVPREERLDIDTTLSSAAIRRRMDALLRPLAEPPRN